MGLVRPLLLRSPFLLTAPRLGDTPSVLSEAAPFKGSCPFSRCIISLTVPEPTSEGPTPARLTAS